MFRFGCPTCKSILQVEDPSVTTKVTCSKCGNRLAVPQPPVPLAPTKQAAPAPAPSILAVVPVNPPSAIPVVVPAPAAIPVGPVLAAPNPVKAKAKPPSRVAVAWVVGGIAVFVVFVFVAAGATLLWMLLKPGATPAASSAAVDDAGTANPASPAEVAKPQESGTVPIVSAGAAKSYPAAKLTDEQVYNRVLQSTVWINNPSLGWGTGVLVNADEKLVLTNCHVLLRSKAFQGTDILEAFDDKLGKDDPLDSASNRPFKTYTFEFSRDKVYRIDMMSGQFDSYLKILDAGGSIIAFDDDSGGFLNARIKQFKPPSSGKYRIVATTFDGKLGLFTLVVSQLPAGGWSSFQANPKVASWVTVNFPEFAGGQVIADKAHYWKINRAQKEKRKGTVMASNEINDLALVKLSYLPEGVVPLPLSKESAKPTQKVHSIGNPGGSGALWAYTSGTVRTSPYQKQWVSLGEGGKMNHDAMIIETQSPTNPGDSGGPLVNERGELLALTQGVNMGVNSINLFIDVSEIRGFLKTHGVTWVEQ